MAIGLAVARGRLQQTIANVGALASHHGHEGLQPHPDLNLSNSHDAQAAVCPGNRGRKSSNALLSVSIEGVQCDYSSTHLSFHHRPGGLRHLHLLAEPEVHKTHAAPPPPKSQYVAAAANMEAGQVIKAENLHMVDWPASMPLAGAFTAPQPLVGRVVLYPLAAGEPILERQLSTPGSGNGITVKIPDGMRALSLTHRRSRRSRGLLASRHPCRRPGYAASHQCPDPMTTTVLQDAEVLATGQKTEPDPEGKPVTATVVTILVSPKDAERVVLASTQGVGSLCAEKRR